MPDAGDILLADDDPDFIVLMRAAFEQLGISIPLKAVSDGSEVIAYLEGKSGYGSRAAPPLPRLILLDLKLPRVTGIEVLRWIRSQPWLAGLQVVVLTGAEIESGSRTAQELGATPWLVKPFSFSQLVEMIERLRDCWLQPHRPVPAQ